MYGLNGHLLFYFLGDVHHSGDRLRASKQELKIGCEWSRQEIEISGEWSLLYLDS